MAEYLEWQSLAWLLAALLMMVGLAGLLLPAIPGPPLLFAGMWLGAWAGGYAHVGLGWLLLLGVLALLAMALDFIAGAMGAKRYGASRWAVVGALLGALVGLFFGIFGLLLGPFIGAVSGELIAGRPMQDAGRAGFGATLGLIVGTAAKLAIGLTMLGLFGAAHLG